MFRIAIRFPVQRNVENLEENLVIGGIGYYSKNYVELTTSPSSLEIITSWGPFPFLVCGESVLYDYSAVKAPYNPINIIPTTTQNPPISSTKKSDR